MFDHRQQLDRMEAKIDHAHTVLHGGINSVQSMLGTILSRLDALKAQGERLMSVADDMKAGIALLNEETNANAASLDAIQANITQLASRIKNSMSDAEVADIQAGLKGLSDLSIAESARLKTLAQDPTVPVPPVPAALAALRKKI